MSSTSKQKFLPDFIERFVGNKLGPDEIIPNYGIHVLLKIKGSYHMSKQHVGDNGNGSPYYGRYKCKTKEFKKFKSFDYQMPKCLIGQIDSNRNLCLDPFFETTDTHDRCEHCYYELTPDKRKVIFAKVFEKLVF